MYPLCAVPRGREGDAQVRVPLPRRSDSNVKCSADILGSGDACAAKIGTVRRSHAAREPVRGGSMKTLILLRVFNDFLGCGQSRKCYACGFARHLLPGCANRIHLRLLLRPMRLPARSLPQPTSRWHECNHGDRLVRVCEMHHFYKVL